MPHRTRHMAAVLLLVCVAAVHVAQAQPAAGYLGCYQQSKLSGVRAKQTGLGLSACTKFCRGKATPIAAVSSSLECSCISLVPSDAAAVGDASCAGAGRAALFYLVHEALGGQGCKVANVPAIADNFDVAYNAEKITWDNNTNTFTMRMDGQSGTRLSTKDGWYKYGVYQVKGLINGITGVVSAFYVRSSDEYNIKNYGDFSEIDMEFLNGNPTKPHTLWFNSFTKGVSGGEVATPPEAYRALLGLQPNATNSNTWLTYSFDWQPDHVTWYVNGVPLLRKYYDQNIMWHDMKGQTYSRLYRPPTEASHVVFSMWSDTDQKRAFGGKLDWDASPYNTSFGDLRRVLCDANITATAAPGWVTATASKGDKPAPPSPRPASPAPTKASPAPTTSPSPAAQPVKSPKPAKPSPGPVPTPTPALKPGQAPASPKPGAAQPLPKCVHHAAQWKQCGGTGGICPPELGKAVCNHAAPWVGACCPDGFVCKSANPKGYYFMCARM